MPSMSSDFCCQPSSFTNHSTAPSQTTVFLKHKPVYIPNMSDSSMKKFLCDYSLSYLNFNSQCWALDFVCVELDLVEKATRRDMKCFPSLNTNQICENSKLYHC